MADILHSESRNNRRAHHSKTVKVVRVQEASYVSDYKVSLLFNDGNEKTIDVWPYLAERPHPQYDKYRDVEIFKTFSVDMGNVVWGDNWDLIFPVEQLHEGEIRY